MHCIVSSRCITQEGERSRMDATQQIEDSFYDQEEEEVERRDEGNTKEPLAKLMVFKNEHIPETELPLYLGDNTLGRDPHSCSLPLFARSISKQHAVISISAVRGKGACRGKVAMETLIWDLGSMNGTRKGRLKLTPQVRYALGNGESVVLADLPCQYVTMETDFCPPRQAMPSKKEAARRLGRSPETPTVMPESGITDSKMNGEKSPGAQLAGCADARSLSYQELRGTPSSAKVVFVEQTPSPQQPLHKTHETASHSDSPDLSSPTCSTFLSPASKVVPESGDESSITPSSSVMNRRRDSSSEVETGGEPRPDFNLDSDTDVEEEEDVLKVKNSPAAAVPSEIPASSATASDFHMDSDTDVEDERPSDVPASAKEAISKLNGQQAPPSSELHLDSDTDVEEEEDGMKTQGDTASAAASAVPSKVPVSSAQPADFHLDSETDVEGEEDADVSKATISEVAPPPPTAELQMDSDTDVEEGNEAEEEKKREEKESSKSVEKSLPLAFDSESETDDEDPFKPQSTEAQKGSKMQQQQLDLLQVHSDSDTDAEENISLQSTTKPTVAEETKSPQHSVATGNRELHTESDQHTSREDDTAPRQSPSVQKRLDEFGMDSDTDVEDEGEIQKESEKRSVEKEGRDQQGAAAPQCSTPRQTGVYEEMETQAFLSPSLQDREGGAWPGPALLQSSTPRPAGVCEEDLDTQEFVCPSQPFKRPALPPSVHPSVSSGDSSQEVDEDLIEDTQPYGSTVDESILSCLAGSGSPGERGSSLRLGLSDSNTTLPQGEAGSCHAATSADVEDSGTDEDWALEPTQLYGARAGPRGSRAAPGRAGPELEATQAYEAKGEGDEDEERARPSDSPPRSNLSTAETQPMAAEVLQGSKDEEGRSAPVRRGRPGGSVTAEDSEDATQQSDVFSDPYLCMADTQIIRRNNESERSEPAPHPYLTTAPTLPTCAHEHKDDEQEGAAKQQGGAEEEETQPMEAAGLSHIFTAETLPIAALEDEESDEEEQEEDDARTAAPKSRGRAQRAKAGPSRRATRGRGAVEEEETEKEETAESQRRTRGKTSKDKRGGRRRRWQTSSEEEEESEREKNEKLERERKEREEMERSEKEQREQEEQGRIEREKKERLERERKEEEEKERLEKEKKEREEKERIEKERLERERTEKEENERLEMEEKEREEKEKVERENDERLERERKEKERLDKERTEREEKERVDIEREKVERQKKEEMEMKQRQEQERVEKERQENERIEREERERQEREQKKLHPTKQEGEEEAKAEASEKQREEERPKTTRSRRTTRRTPAAPTRVEEDSTALTADDVPAKRTRSRSNSSNSCTSEQSSSSTCVRGKGGPAEAQPRTGRRTARTKMAAAPPGEPQEPDPDAVSGKLGLDDRARRSRSGSVASDHSATTSSAGQSRGRGRGRKSMKANGPDPEPVLEPKEEAPVPKTSSGGRKSRRVTAGNVAMAIADRCPQKSVTSVKVEPEEASEAVIPKAVSRGRGRRTSTAARVEDKSTEAAAETSGGRRGRKRSHEEEEKEGDGEFEDVEEIRFSIPKGRARRGGGKVAEEEVEKDGGMKEDKEEVALPSTAQRAMGRHTAAQRRKREKEEGEKEEAGREKRAQPSTPEPVNQEQKNEKPERGSKKRSASVVDASPTLKTPRRSLTIQSYKVLFTGVVDEQLEGVVTRLGGSMAKGVTDMSHLVTDKVRRTVKFLCAVARGVPIISIDWLKKCGKAGSFLPVDDYLVKDVEQEKKFSFSLTEALQTASTQPLLKGYEVHVTRSVKPEPVQMKDIITCSGARYLAKMPTAHKEQTVVVSCEEDGALCRPAVTAGLPVVSAEFVLTGILQQRVDLSAHALTGHAFHPKATPPPARGRKKT